MAAQPLIRIKPGVYRYVRSSRDLIVHHPEIVTTLPWTLFRHTGQDGTLWESHRGEQWWRTAVIPLADVIANHNYSWLHTTILAYRNSIYLPHD
jgi:hypothetical protein